MPLKWTEPEVVIDGTEELPTVYHTYKSGDWNSRTEYWFTTDMCERDINEFDVRDLPTYSPELSVLQNLRIAHTLGHIKHPVED